MERTGSSETLLITYKTRRHSTEDYNPHIFQTLSITFIGNQEHDKVQVISEDGRGGFPWSKYISATFP
jgi:hypothetical protein